MNAADYLILLLMVAVLGVLIWGVIGMMRGNDPKRSNKLMVWRVVLQGVVIVLAGLFLMAK